MKIKAILMISIFLLFSLTLTSLMFNNVCKAKVEGIYVDSSYKGVSNGSAMKPYKTIQEAIDAADEGETIYVFGGQYNENLKVNKKLKLWGSIEGGASVIDYSNDLRYTVEITADYVEMEDFSVYDNNSKKESVIGALICIKSNNVVIQGNTIGNTKSRGIYIAPSASGNVISGNIINNTNEGVYVDSSDTNDIFNNLIGNSSKDKYGQGGDGAYLVSSLNTRLYNNTFKYNYNGANIESCNSIEVINNTFNETSHYCLYIQSSNLAIIKNNSFLGNSGDGIYLDSLSCKIFNNTFNYNVRGINVIGSDCRIFNNTISNSTASGIYTYSNSRNNLIYLNKIVNNGKSAEENGDNFWYNATTNKGNYWSDYKNVDRDLDGVGDFYYTTGGVLDIYPLGYFLKPPNKPDNPSPEDLETGVGLKITLEVDVEDVDSDTLTVYFYNAEDDTLMQGTFQNPVTRVESGSRVSCSFTRHFNATIAWYVVVNDSKLENRSDTWVFVTRTTPPDNIPPVAEAGGPYSAEAHEPLQLDASGCNDPDGTVVFYRWNFGDGSSQIIEQKPTHRYMQEGTYTATLTIIDNDGSSATDTTTVEISPTTNQEPTANMNIPSTGYAGSVVSFSSSGSSDPDGDQLTYLWSFGDGNTSKSANPTHIYRDTGTYPVTLKVSDWQYDVIITDSITISQKSKDETPGFEILSFLLIVLFLVIIQKKKNK